ncbi:MAG: D-alanine--D-alanine ligase [Gammaproteobacteria bacterium]|nr:D-alanine--D-alanine ligase [Gammaproteobacteria bacterium]
MTSKLNVAVLYGGPSGEHEVSLRSAASVLTHLNKDNYHLFPIGIDKSGACFYNPIETLLPCEASIPVQTPHSTPLSGLLINGRFVMDVDVVFPVVHGPLLEDGALQGILELAQVAYVGSNVLSAAVCMDKDISRRLTRLEGIQSAQYQTLSIHNSPAETKERGMRILQEFGLPVFVKPCCMGSSVGIHKVSEPSMLNAAITDALRFDETILIEQAVQGLEIEVAVLENIDPHLPPLVSVPGELKISHPDGFYSYHAKYIDSDLTELCVPADLPATLIDELSHTAAHIFTLLKCKGMARIDFFVNVDTHTLYFNEANTLPGFTSISMYPRLWQASGLPYDKLLDKLIALACMTQQNKQKRIRDYQ